MSEYKEFSGKSLDEAISEARSYFDAPREKLEIDIIEDAKTGIFGIVGARKARIRARMAKIPNFGGGENKEPFSSERAEEPAGGAEAKKNSESSGKERRPAKARSKKKDDAAGSEMEPPSADLLSESVSESSAGAVSDDASADSAGVSAKTSRRSMRAKQGKSARRTEKGAASGQGDPERSGGRPRQERIPGGRKAAGIAGSEAGSVQPAPEDPAKAPMLQEDDDSQLRFLSVMGTDEEELDELALERLDREAAAKANMLGNITTEEFFSAERGRRGNERRPIRSRNVPGMRGRGTPVQRDGDFGGTNDTKNEQRQASQRREGRFRRDKAPVSSESRQGANDLQNVRNTPAAQVPGSQDDREEYTAQPRIPLAELDRETLFSAVKDVLTRLVGPIVGFNIPMEMSIVDDKVKVRVECADTGLLIGREGQRLSAVQYLAARILSRRFGTLVRIHVDTGDYHAKRDERVQEVAMALAERVRETGRPQSTHPLSAYQRRVVHLALQDVPDVRTRSVGNGPLKRVIIMKADNASDPSMTEDVLSQVPVSDISGLSFQTKDEADAAEES